jgi:Kef-type K+ transport system membrane component KefB
MARILLDIFIMFVAAKLAAELFERRRQPAVIGELLAGILIGPFALGLIGHPDAGLITIFHSEVAATEAVHTVYEVLAEIGVIVLLFYVGLETRLDDILGVGKRAMIVATLGVIVPFVLGYLLLSAFGYPTITSVFLGTAMVATSVGITARVLADLGVLRRQEARIILGAAVVDDILGMMILAVVGGLGSQGSISWMQIGIVGAEAIAFTVFVVLVGRGTMRRFDCHLDSVRVRNGAFVVGITICLGLAALASYVGLAAIIGAFLAGMVFAEARQCDKLIDRALPLYDFLVPFFFIYTGTQVNLQMFLDANIIGLALMVTALAIIGKLVGCTLGMLGMNRLCVTVVGVGMIPRGEVGLIVASIGRALGVLPDDLFGIIVLMSILTTLIVPPILGLIYRQATPASLDIEKE